MGVSPGQSWEFMSGIATHIPWGQMSSFKVQQIMNEPGWQERVARRFMHQIEHNFPAFPTATSNILEIDRSKPFDPVALGRGWKIEEEDERSLGLTGVNLTDVQFKAMLEGCETSVKGETKLKRLKKAGYIRLDAKIFQTLWENQRLIPEHWKEETNREITLIYFDGTILRDSHGFRFVLYLYWKDGAWDWGLHWLINDWNVNCPSAVLPAAA